MKKLIKTHTMKYALLFTVFAPTLALAEFPRLTANNNYLSVEIRAGTDSQSADQMSVIYQGKASKGQTFDGQEGQRICARRESIPGSSSGGWSSWNCASSYKGLSVGQPKNTDF